MASDIRMNRTEFASSMFLAYMVGAIMGFIVFVFCNMVIDFPAWVGGAIFYGVWSITSLPLRMRAVIKRLQDFNFNSFVVVCILFIPLIFFIFNLIFTHWLKVFNPDKSIIQFLFDFTRFVLAPVALLLIWWLPSGANQNQEDDIQVVKEETETKYISHSFKYEEKRERNKYTINKDGTITFRNRDEV